MRSLGALALATTILATSPSLARGQPSGVLRPPTLVHFEPPDVALETPEDIAVLLELDVAASGEIDRVRVVEPAGEPFDSAAASAASRFLFEPATRDGAPIAARIRYRYVFTATAVPPAEPAPEEPRREAPPIDMPPPEPEPALVGPSLPPPSVAFAATARVAGPPREPLRYTIDRREVQRTAGAHGDALRATELLPGVTSAPSTSTGGIVVRGAHPLDTQVMVEGAPVPLLNHVGGYTSFWNAWLLDRVELHPSNFSVRFGRALGAVVDVTIRDELREGVHGAAEVTIVDAWASVEGGTQQIRGAIAARRSWIDAIYGAVLGNEHLVTAPVYYDYQSVVRYAPSHDDTLRLVVYGSRDDVALDYREPGRDPSFQGSIHNLTQFHRGQLEWRHRYSPTVRHDVRLMAGYLGYDQQVGRLLRASDEGIELNLRGELSTALGDHATLVLGYDGWAHQLDVTYAGPPAPAPEGDPAGFGLDDPEVHAAASTWIARSALYLEARLAPVSTFTVVPGVRVDYIGDVDEWSVEPRIAAQLALGDSTLVRGGVGLFAQPPQLGRTLAGFGNPELGLERAAHASVGVQSDFFASVRVSLDGYYKQMFDRIVSTADGGAPYLVNDGSGRAYGAELAARWIGDPRFSASLSYALSRSERRDRDGAWRRFDYDQTHVLTAAVAYDLGDGWEAGATFRLASGTPYTEVVSAIYDATTDRYVPRYGATNGADNPLWHRLDLRVAKTFVVDGSARVQLSLDVMNATNQLPQQARIYAYDYRTSIAQSGLPIVPNLGIRGEL